MCSELRSLWLWKLPKFSVGSTLSSFHSLHATSQPLHPMHFEISTSFEYSGAFDRRASSGINALGLADIRRMARLSGIGNYAGSTFTRKLLNSGHFVFASPTNDVSWLAIEPAVNPTKPQCTGIPIVQFVRPLTRSGRIRLVTIAVPVTDPRFDQTLTWLAFAIPFSAASPSGTSTKKSAWPRQDTARCSSQSAHARRRDTPCTHTETRSRPTRPASRARRHTNG